MPASYDTTSRHFDSALADACPIPREQTLAEMARRIARDAVKFATWQVRRKVCPYPAKDQRSI